MTVFQRMYLVLELPLVFIKSSPNFYNLVSSPKNVSTQNVIKIEEYLNEDLPKDRKSPEYTAAQMKLYAEIVSPFLSLFMTKNFKNLHGIIVAFNYTFKTLLNSAGKLYRKYYV